MQRVSVAFGAVAVVGLLLAVCFFPMVNSSESSADGGTSSFDYTVTADANHTASIFEVDKNSTFTVKYQDEFDSNKVYTLGDKTCLRSNANTSATEFSFDVNVPTSTSPFAAITINAGELAGKLYIAQFVLNDGTSDITYRLGFFGKGYFITSTEISDGTTEKTVYLDYDTFSVTSNNYSKIAFKGVSGNAQFTPSEDSWVKSVNKTSYIVDTETGGFSVFDVKPTFKSGTKASFKDVATTVTMVDGSKTCTITFIMTDNIPEPGQDSDPEPVVCDYDVSATINSPNVWIPHTFPSNSIQQFSIKYTNNLIDATKTYTVVSAQVCFNGEPSGLATVSVRTPISGVNFVAIDYNGSVASSSTSGEIYYAEIHVELASGDDVVSFVVSLGNNAYWNEMDTASVDVQTLTLFKGEDALSANHNSEYVMLKGISSVSSIECEVPAVTVTNVEDNSISNGGFSLLRVTVDWNQVVNGIYPVTVNPGPSAFSFNLYVNKCSMQPTDEYDYSFVGVTTVDHGKVDWNADEKDQLTIKAQLPRMASSVSITGMLMVGTMVYPLADFVNYEVIQNNVEEKYVIFTLSNKSLSISSDNYRISLGNAGTIDLNVILNYGKVTTVDSEGCCSVSDWNKTDEDAMRVRINGLPELEQDIRIIPSVFKDGVRITDYSAMLTLYAVYFREGYILLSVDSGSELAEGSYRFEFTNAGNNYDLEFNVVDGNGGSGNIADYSMNCEARQNGANTHLTVFIQKGTSGTDLSDVKLLVIAKYQGGIVVNFYTSPTMENGAGTDHIEVTTLNLKEVIVELVDGFQNGNPEYYGVCSYSIQG